MQELTSHWMIYSHLGALGWAGGDPLFDRDEARSVYGDSAIEGHPTRATFIEYDDTNGLLVNSEDQTEAFAEWYAESRPDDGPDHDARAHERLASTYGGYAA